MTEIEKKCIEWGKSRGLFDGEPIQAWRAQFIKLLQEMNELETAVKKDILEEVEAEFGDCLFVLNNLYYLMCERRTGNEWPSEEQALDSALTMDKPIETIMYYKRLAYLSYMAVLESTGVELDSDQSKEHCQYILAKTLEKNSKRKGKTVAGNFIKD